MAFLECFNWYSVDKQRKPIATPLRDQQTQMKIVAAQRALRAENDELGIPLMRHILLPGAPDLDTVKRVVHGEHEFIDYNPLWVDDNSIKAISEELALLMQDEGLATIPR